MAEKSFLDFALENDAKNKSFSDKVAEKASLAEKQSSLANINPEDINNYSEDQKKKLAIDQIKKTGTGEHGDFMSGLYAGGNELQALAGGATALASDIIGYDKGVEYGMEVFNRNNREAAAYKKAKFSEDAIDWAQYTIGNLVPTALEAAGGALVGSLIAPGAGTATGALAGRTILKKGIEKLTTTILKKSAEEGAVKLTEAEARKLATNAMLKSAASKAGVVGTTWQMESGGNYGDARNMYGDKVSTAAALGTGLVSGLLELAGGNIRIIDGILGTKTAKVFSKAIKNKNFKVIKEIAAEAVREAPAEAAQEALQQISSIANLKLNDSGYVMNTKENWEQIGESAGAGALGGVAFGSMGAAAEIGVHAKNKLKELNAKAKAEIAKEEAAKKEAGTASGTEPTSILDGAETAEEVKAQEDLSNKADTVDNVTQTASDAIDEHASAIDAQTEQAPTTAIPQEENVATSADTESEQPVTDQNEEPIHESIKKAAEGLGVDSKAVKEEIHKEKDKNLDNFTKRMVKAFGAGIKKFILQLWNYAKSAFKSERGSFSTKPIEKSKYSVEENINKLPKNEVFVFGSNEAGRHGKGAAKIAKDKFGAKYGQGVGEQGQSYAIPTKDKNLKKLPLSKVKQYVSSFIEHAAKNPDKIFNVTAIGTGLAGFKTEDIAPLFKDSPDNVKLPKKWADQETQQESKQTVTPKNNVTAAEKIKAPFKASKATKYIGFGKEGSSTELYGQQLENSIPVNDDKYNDKDVVFVSVNGNPSRTDFNDTLALASQALESGAMVLTDSEEYLAKSKYNKGEKALAKALLEAGYTRQTTKTNKDTAIWKKKKAVKQETTAKPSHVQTEAQTQSTLTPTIQTKKESIELPVDEQVSGRNPKFQEIDGKEFINFIQGKLDAASFIKKGINVYASKFNTSQKNIISAVTRAINGKYLPRSEYRIASLALNDFIESKSKINKIKQKSSHVEETEQQRKERIANAVEEQKQKDTYIVNKRTGKRINRPEKTEDNTIKEKKGNNLKPRNEDFDRGKVLSPESEVYKKIKASIEKNGLRKTKESLEAMALADSYMPIDISEDERKAIYAKTYKKLKEADYNEESDAYYEAQDRKSETDIAIEDRIDDSEAALKKGPKRSIEEKEDIVLAQEGKILSDLNKAQQFLLRGLKRSHEVVGSKLKSIEVLKKVNKQMLQSKILTIGDDNKNETSLRQIILNKLSMYYDQGWNLQEIVDRVLADNNTQTFKSLKELPTTFDDIDTAIRTLLSGSEETEITPEEYQKLEKRAADISGDIDAKLEPAKYRLKNGDVTYHTTLKEGDGRGPIKKQKIIKQEEKPARKETAKERRNRIERREEYKTNKIFQYYQKFSGLLTAAQETFSDMLNAIDTVISSTGIKTAKKINKKQLATIIAKNLKKTNPNSKFLKLTYKEQEDVTSLMIKFANTVRNGETFISGKKVFNNETGKMEPVARELYLAEIIDEQSQMTQLGQEVEIAMIDAFNESPSTFKFINVGGQYYRDVEVSYNNGTKKTLRLQKSKEISRLKAIAESKIGELEGQEKEDALARLLDDGIENITSSEMNITSIIPAKTATNFSNNMVVDVKFWNENKGVWSNTQEIPEISYRRLVAQGTKIKLIGKPKKSRYELLSGWTSQTEDMDNNLIGDIFTEYMKKSPLANSEIFEQISKDLSKEDIKITRAELVRAYVEAGGDSRKFIHNIHTIVEAQYKKIADVVYAQASSLSREEIVFYLSKDLSPKERELFNEVLINDTKPKYSERNKNELTAIQRIKFDTLKQAYYNMIALKQAELKKEFDNQKEIEKHLLKMTTDGYSKNGIQINLEDLVQDKTEISNFEQSIVSDDNNLRVVTLRNKLAQAFYKSIAHIFNADLVIVASDNYTSRYIGKASDGRPKVIINIKDSTPFAKIFAHEIFHHIVNKSTLKQYQAFKKAMLEMTINNPEAQAAIKELKKGDSLMQEETLAEVFAWAVTQRGFYEHLAKSQHGKGIARKLIASIIKHMDRVGVLQGQQSYYEYEGQKIFGKHQLDDIYELIHDLADESFNNRSLNHDETRYHTLNATKAEVEGYLKNTAKWLKGAWRQIFPKGSKSYKDIMSAIERLLVKSLKVMNKIKPVGMMSDWLANKEDVRLAHIIANNAERAVARAKVKTKKYRETFKSFVIDKQNSLVEDLENGLWYVDKDEEGYDVYKKGKPESDTATIIDPNNVEHKYFVSVLKDLHSHEKLMEKMHDDIVRGQLDLTNDEDIAKAKELGYSDEVIEAFQKFKSVTDEIFSRLKKEYPDLDMLPSHYGQSIKWYHNDGNIVDDTLDAVINPELNNKITKMKGSEQFKEAKNLEMSTREIADKYELYYKTIDPMQLFTEYVRDAERLLNMNRMLREGKASGRIHVFGNGIQAAERGFHAVNDNATKIMRNLRTINGFVLVNGDNEYYKKNGMDLTFNTKEEAQTFFRLMSKEDKRNFQIEEVEQAGNSSMEFYAVYKDGELVDYFNSEEEATKYADLKNQMEENRHPFNKKFGEKEDKIPKYVAKGVVVQAKESEVARYYFKPDLAKMLNNLFAEDKFRGNNILGVSGHTWMNIKNHMTSIQFALSGFHFLTVSNEMMATFLSWSYLKNKQLGDNGVGLGTRIKELAPTKVWKESREIVSLLEYVMENEGIERDNKEIAAAQKRLAEILKTDDVNAVDLLDMFFHAGGLMEQDRSLRASAHDVAKMRYREDESIQLNEDGEAVFNSTRGVNGKVMLDSIKEAIESEKAKHPNNPIIAQFNVARFVSMEASTAWLMEGFIPKVKMAMWVREYTLKLDQQSEALAKGETTKEEIARQTMKFIEDRFGEVNWRNMWMNPTIKTTLQFLFRSFTWFTGSWKALGKAGIDIGKLGWFTVKGEKYTLTEKGWWGINALMVHMLTVSAVSTLYLAATALTGEGGGDDDQDKDIPLLTKLLFPRVDPLDPAGRITVPSYITELYKIMAATGIVGVTPEPHKLISGRVNSIISNSIEALENEDWRGVKIRQDDSGVTKQFIDTFLHIFGVLPISLSTIMSDTREHGFRPEYLAFGMLGLTSAPAAAKRSNAVNLAYKLRREEHRSRTVSSDVMELKDSTKRAAYQYGRGNTKPLIELVQNNKITIKQFENAISRLPTINGKKNPTYVDPLTAAIKGLSIEGTIKVWKVMNKDEKARERMLIFQKYQNIKKRNTRSIENRQKILSSMREVGIIK